MKPDVHLPSPLLPATAGPLAPTHAALVEPYRAEVHTDVRACAECHPSHFAQWRESTHHLASFNNPFYRVSFEDYVAEVGRDRGRFCAGCHDPALLADDALSRPVAPQDHRAHAGVTCMSCHGVIDAKATGVGSYALKTDSIEAPVDGKPETLVRHRVAMAGPALKSDALCISCHKGFLSKASGHSTFLPALDEHRPWRESAWNGSNARRMPLKPVKQTCRSCHMKEDAQGHHSHRFAGGHATLARAIASPEQLSAIEAVTRDRIGLQVERSPGAPNGLQVDVVIVNHGVGHRFPGGARDLRDTWIEIEFLDLDGHVIASSGRHYRTDASELDVHRLRVGLVDSKGDLVETHGVGHFRTPAFDHTIAPQDAAIARYDLPESLAHRVNEVRARLLQRRLSSTFHAYACERSKTDDGVKFIQATQDFSGLVVDACAEQPILTLAESVRKFGENNEVADWERLYWHGVGLTRDLQERARYAIEAFRAALEVVPAGERRAEVMVRTELARALLRAGRSGDALKELKLAEEVLPTEPVVYALQAQALRQTWKLTEMIEPLKKAVKLAPNDAGLARELAMAYGSTKEHSLALSAAQDGLKLEPRDVDLLRLQMLAYQHLEAGSDSHREAERVFLAHKRDEDASSIRIACSRVSKECLKEQLPIPLRTLKLNKP